MTFSQALMVAGIAVSAAVALIVAHLHRRQMRQIELYKNDPSVGLVPPPSKLTAFVASKWDSVLAFAGPAFILFNEFVSKAPVTRTTVFVVSAALAFLFTNLVMSLVFRLQQRNMERFSQLLQLHEKSLGSTEKLLDLMEQSRARTSG